MKQQAGYATWEMIGLVPFYVLVVLIIVQVALAPLTAFRAEVSAWSAVRAAVRGNDPEVAARVVAGSQLATVEVGQDDGCGQQVSVALAIPTVLPFMRGMLPQVRAAFTMPTGTGSC